MGNDQVAAPEEAKPHIDFTKHIKLSGRSTSEVERQVTVCRYKTYVGFNFDQICAATQRGRLKLGEELGIIDIRTSKDAESTEENQLDRLEGDDHETEWVRALFGFISDKYFRWLDLESRDIYEFMIEGVLSETFLAEYYQTSEGEIEFLTYGGSQREDRIKAKHRSVFRMQFGAQLVEFPYEFVRTVCSRPEFRTNLKEIGYAPLGEAGYGTVDKSSMKTRYANTIDWTAERVKEILENPKIQISEFSARATIHHLSVRTSLNIRFHLTKRGRVTLYFPRIEFNRPMTDVERENEFYEIVRVAYTYITGTKNIKSSGTDKQREVTQQLSLDAFLEDV